MKDEEKVKENKICKELIDKYPDLKNYKTGSRLKIQKKSIKEILEILVEQEDKDKFQSFIDIRNNRVSKDIKVVKEEEVVEEGVDEGVYEGVDEGVDEVVEDKEDKEVKKVKKVKKVKPSEDKPYDDKPYEDSIRKQRDNLLKKLSSMQGKYEALQEKYDNLELVYKDFKIDYKNVCHLRNKYELTLEKKGWGKEKLLEFEKYKNFYHKYSEIVEELDKHKK